ncbi:MULTISPECIES: glutamate racemase [Bacillus]|uniref:Glutamate racemase n=2 Tax=Bacillus TaxID=1386 RepID=A0A0M3RAT6_9BACI|nr:MULTISPECIES: glutamate racemase [Bacillus]ALC83766.1 glutamate racemase [Bacillus gobiensis]MBP1083989.1 glutamate racemase [Bacillus capparidis]MED1096965.1 glutamate racemase [Bacillus capparidis]
MKIAFFDSGIGGITVLHEAMKQLPREDFVFFADTLHVPYGTKSKADVKEYVKQSVETIREEEVKALVIACNTATSIAVSELRNTYDFPIIGMEPAVKPALEISRSAGKRVLVFATPLTLKQSKYTQLVSRIDDQRLVDSLPLPELVELCERLNFESQEVIDYFTEKLSSFDLNNYGTVVLGCTHYPFYKHVLRSILPNHIQIVDGSVGTVHRLAVILSEAGQLHADGNADTKFLCSSQNPDYIRKMEKALTFIQNHE